MSYCRELQFKDKPDYDKLKNLFKNLMKKNGWENDYEYDWVKNKK